MAVATAVARACGMLRHELELFFNALRFFTRLPVPGWVGHPTELLNHAARYFPLVGWVVGGVGALVLWGAAAVLPLGLALLLSMTATILLTGAFHEDGFGDACDGFGGGWDKAQVLAIMKDSRIGSYAAVGLGLMLLGKFQALAALGAEAAMTALLAAHPLSRFASTALIFALDYVRDDAGARAKPLAHRMSRGELAVAALWGALPLVLLAPLQALAAAGAAAAAAFLAARYFLRRIGGYTGDCLGATQQVAELAIYVALNLAWIST